MRALRGAALAAALVLAGCNTTPDPEVRIGLRNPTVTLAGSTRFDAARFTGDWQTLACLGTCAAQVPVSLGPDGVISVTTAAGQTAFRQTGPGILRAVGGADILVVMWIDEGYRTAVVGDANGRWAAIMDRGRGAPDRLRAATEVLDFNGWDVTRLRKVEG